MASPGHIRRNHKCGSITPGLSQPQQQGLGQARPNKKLSHGAENFQEWTTDGFFRETQDMVRYRRAEGCTTVEMECAALAACARKRGASFGQILYTADSLANIYAHDERDWGKGSLRKALELCIAVLQTI